MSGAREVAKNAEFEIEDLIVEMLDGNFSDNEISLGRVLLGNKQIQVQLKITTNKNDFLYSDNEDEDE